MSATRPLYTGMASVHPLGGREFRVLRRLQRETPEGARTVHVFSKRLAPLSLARYQRMVARAGEAARFPFLVHSHMLRHSCGYKLANDGQDTRHAVLAPTEADFSLARAAMAARRARAAALRPSETAEIQIWLLGSKLDANSQQRSK